MNRLNQYAVLVLLLFAGAAQAEMQQLDFISQGPEFSAQ